MRYILVLTLGFIVSLTGCGKEYSPVYTAGLNAAGENVNVVAGYTKEASVFKEQEVHKTLRNRDIQHYKMYAISGFQMVFAMQEVSPGIFALLPKQISYREEPDFEQQLPIKPSEHPVWTTTASIFTTVAKYGLIGFGLSELSGVLTAGYDAAGHTFSGTNNIENSLNTAGGNQAFTGAAQYQGDVFAGDTALPKEKPPYIEDGKCFVSPGCSCDSFMGGLCT